MIHVSTLHNSIGFENNVIISHFRWCNNTPFNNASYKTGSLSEIPKSKRAWDFVFQICFRGRLKNSICSYSNPHGLIGRELQLVILAYSSSFSAADSDHRIPQVTNVLDLGVPLDTTFTASAHCIEAANTARRLLFMVRRSFCELSKTAFTHLI